ncbi:MAG: transglycosylase domain-containing protein [Candidatus Dormibacteria bacterium]
MKQPPTSSRRRRANLPQEGGVATATTKSGKRWGLSRRWRRVLGVFAGLIAVLAGVLGGLVAYASITLPDVNDIGKHTGTIKIVDHTGKPIAEVGHDNNSRHTVTINQIAQIMQDATTAAEDHNFYSEGAFDPKRVLKALVVDVILRRPAEGASTITQQLAKQAFFGAQAEKSPLRKLREALLANEINARFSKPQILEMYLNINYYGENAYGIEDASQRYFGKHASELNLSEAAMLAGLPQAPSADDPYVSQANSFARMHYVLISLVQIGKATQQQAQDADPLNPDGSPNAQHQTAILDDLKRGKPSNFGIAPHFVQYVQDQLTGEFGGDPSYIQGDLTVTTTLDLDTQAHALDAVTQGVNKIGHMANNGALLMMNSHTGDIMAMVGSANFSDNAIAGQYNITTALRRPGSSFKPYVYETAFKNGVLRPDSTLHDTRQESQKLGGVNNFDLRFEGNISAASALLGSRNVATEDAASRVGMQNIANFAYSLGIDPNTEPITDNLSSAIGTSSIRMVDHTAAYSAFSNGGHKVAPRSILKVTDGQGNVLVDHTQDVTDKGVVMTPAEAWGVTQILRGYAKHWGLGFKYDTAGKSGTTDNFVDAWYMVYTPDWVTATWTGHTDGTKAGEVGMDGVFGTDEGKAIAVPFVNTLPKPSAFQPVRGALPNCNSSDQSFSGQAGCPTPTPRPTPSPTATPSATETPTALPSPTETTAATPTPCVVPKPGPKPKPTPPPCP